MAHKHGRQENGLTDGFLTRCGYVSFSGERTLWFHGSGREAFEAVRPLVQALRGRFQRLDFLFTSADPSTRRWLAEAFPGASVLPPPMPLGYCANRYLVKLNVRGLVFLSGPDLRDHFILRAAHWRALPAVLTSIEAKGGSELPADIGVHGAYLQSFQHCFAATEAVQEALVAAGVAAGRISLLAADPQARQMALLAAVTPLLAQDLKLMRSEQRPVRRWLEQVALGCMDRPRLRRWLSAKVERIDTIDQLRDNLGNPATILCLGNGPSSEAAEVGRVDFDCLFRVNHVWLTRGFLTAPDMVFTNAKTTLAVVRGAVFGLLSVKSEARLLVKRVLLPQFRRIRYTTIERFGLYLSDMRWEGIRPTNGAVMLATAVALKPSKLVISGIDLFSHPAGTYPGDSKTPNAYSPGHNAESELALLLEALSLYEGELTILSPTLKARWEEHRAGRLKRLDATA